MKGLYPSIDITPEKAKNGFVDKTYDEAIYLLK